MVAKVRRVCRGVLVDGWCGVGKGWSQSLVVVTYMYVGEHVRKPWVRKD